MGKLQGFKFVYTIFVLLISQQLYSGSVDSASIETERVHLTSEDYANSNTTTKPLEPLNSLAAKEPSNGNESMLVQVHNSMAENYTIFPTTQTPEEISSAASVSKPTDATTPMPTVVHVNLSEHLSSTDKTNKAVIETNQQDNQVLIAPNQNSESIASTAHGPSTEITSDTLNTTETNANEEVNAKPIHQKDLADQVVTLEKVQSSHAPGDANEPTKGETPSLFTKISENSKNMSIPANDFAEEIQIKHMSRDVNEPSIVETSTATSSDSSPVKSESTTLPAKFIPTLNDLTQTVQIDHNPRSVNEPTVETSTPLTSSTNPPDSAQVEAETTTVSTKPTSSVIDLAQKDLQPADPNASSSTTSATTVKSEATFSTDSQPPPPTTSTVKSEATSSSTDSPPPPPTTTTSTGSSTLDTTAVPPSDHTHDSNTPVQQFFSELRTHTVLCLISLLLLLLTGTVLFSFVLTIFIIVKYSIIGLIKLCKSLKKCSSRRKSSSSFHDSGSLFPRCDVNIRPYEASSQHDRDRY